MLLNTAGTGLKLNNAEVRHLQKARMLLRAIVAFDAGAKNDLADILERMDKDGNYEFAKPAPF